MMNPGSSERGSIATGAYAPQAVWGMLSALNTALEHANAIPFLRADLVVYVLSDGMREI